MTNHHALALPAGLRSLVSNHKILQLVARRRWYCVLQLQQEDLALCCRTSAHMTIYNHAQHEHDDMMAWLVVHAGASTGAGWRRCTPGTWALQLTGGVRLCHPGQHTSYRLRSAAAGKQARTTPRVLPVLQCL